jgi:hypothetical protein
MLLVLPHGWCCMMGLPNIHASASVEMAETPNQLPAENCCSHCKVLAKQQSNPCHDDKPAKPQPIQITCCCGDALQAIPAAETILEESLSLCVVCFSIQLETVQPVVKPRVASFVPSPPRPIHVLHCIWLC